MLVQRTHCAEELIIMILIARVEKICDGHAAYTLVAVVAMYDGWLS